MDAEEMEDEDKRPNPPQGGKAVTNDAGDTLITWESPHGQMTHTPLLVDDERAAPVRMPGVSNIVLHESENVAVLSATVDLSDPAWENHRIRIDLKGGDDD